MMPEDWNKANHPECREDEVFLSNIYPDTFSEMTGYETRRMGSQAYSQLGRPIQGITVPVFVARSEYEARNQT